MYYNEKHKKLVKERGDGYTYIGSYRCNEITIDGKNKGKSKNSYIRVKCPYCSKEYDVQLDSFKRGNKCTNCCNEYENSFAYYIQQELQESLNKYWDWEKNDLNPYLIYKHSSNKVWILCDKTDYHDVYKTTSDHFVSGARCGYCGNLKVHPKDSFGQWLIDTYGYEAIKRYWSPKNTVNPFDIAPNSNKKVWILCQNKKYHNDNGGYLVTPNAFKQNSRCPYCIHNCGRVHCKDSFGSLYPEKAKYWSKTNKKSPYEVAPYSNKKYKFICEKCGEEFKKILNDLNRKDKGVICSNCSSSQLEQSTKKVLDKYNIEYIREYYYENLLSDKRIFLRFDFYLPNYNLLIECQGQQHIKRAKGWQTEESFKRQQIYDKRKKDYCKKNNIKLLEIWYYEIDNIEEILLEKLQIENN